jgi:prepilin-type N-terminal cleavage/methylation domain-containing protein
MAICGPAIKYNTKFALFRKIFNMRDTARYQILQEEGSLFMSLEPKGQKATRRRGFSLVELVVVILIIAILAVAVFAGGSAAIKKAQISRTTSDLHNFSVAIESALNETPSVANMNAESGMTAIINAVNSNLSADYQVSRLSADVSGNITTKQSANDGSGYYVIYQSAKTDAWDNPYYVIFDATERHSKGISEFYITVVSAGPNSQTTISSADTAGKDTSIAGKGIESDDIFLLVQYTDGDVAATTYNCASDSVYYGSGSALTFTTKGSKTSTQGYYVGTTLNDNGTNTVSPVNFQPDGSSFSGSSSGGSSGGSSDSNAAAKTIDYIEITSCHTTALSVTVEKAQYAASGVPSDTSKLDMKIVCHYTDGSVSEEMDPDSVVLGEAELYLDNSPVFACYKRTITVYKGDKSAQYKDKMTYMVYLS